jgi:hypothetical protein
LLQANHPPNLDPTVAPVARFVSTAIPASSLVGSLIFAAVLEALVATIFDRITVLVVGAVLVALLAHEARRAKWTPSRPECEIRLYADGIGATSWGGPWGYVSFEDLAGLELYGDGGPPTAVRLTRRDGTSVDVATGFLSKDQLSALLGGLVQHRPELKARVEPWLAR